MSESDSDGLVPKITRKRKCCEEKRKQVDGKLKRYSGEVDILLGGAGKTCWPSLSV